MIDCLIPLAKQNCAEVTLLVGMDDDEQRLPDADLPSILSAQGARDQHLDACRERLMSAGIGGRVVRRHGTAVDGIADELCEQHYDLVAIAAEPAGNFVNRVWELVHGRTSAFLVIKA